jgi:hypothetical protein
MEPTILFRDDRLCSATWGPVFFEVWSAPGTAAHFRLLTAQQVKAARAQPGQKVALFTVVLLDKLPALDPETRREIDARTQALTPHMLGSVVVMPAQGFAASVVRSVLAATNLLRRANWSSKVCSTVDDGCGWVVQYLPPVDGRPIKASDLRRACEAATAKGAPLGTLAG